MNFLWFFFFLKFGFFISFYWTSTFSELIFSSLSLIFSIKLLLLLMDQHHFFVFFLLFYTCWKNQRTKFLKEYNTNNNRTSVLFWTRKDNDNQDTIKVIEQDFDIFFFLLFVASHLMACRCKRHFIVGPNTQFIGFFLLV